MLKIMSRNIFTIAIALMITLAGCSKGQPIIPNPEGDASISSAPIEYAAPPFILGKSTASPLLSTDKPPSRYAPDQVLVYLGSNPPPTADVTATASKHGLELIKVHAQFWGTFYQFRITDGASVLDKCAELKNMPEVVIAEPNYLAQFFGPLKDAYWPNDPLWESQWDADSDPGSTTRDQWGPHLYAADTIWPEYNGEGVVIAIIDTGVNSHEDINPNLWTNPDEIAANSIDDDSNGHIDDIHGWDFMDDDSSYSDPGFDYGFEIIYHGTSCAGVAAGRGDNAKGLTGIAPRAQIMCVRTDLWEGSAYYSSVTDAINYAHNEGADIVSMSFGGYDVSDIMEAACDAAYDNGNGTLLLASAGNDDYYWWVYPAAYPSVMAIGACTHFGPDFEPWPNQRITSDYFGWGSNYGPHLAVTAPGVWYIGLYGGGFNQYQTGVDEYDYFGGTSNACPFTAGCMALLKCAFPDMTAEELREHLGKTADDMGVDGKDQYYGYGSINLVRAIYGTDPNESLMDVDGYVPMDSTDSFYDNLNPNPEYGYPDASDYYKFTAPVDMSLPIILEIFNWGKNLKLQVFNNPNQEGVPLAASDHPNGAPPTNKEQVNLPVTAGNIYYIVITAHNLDDCTTYKLATDGDLTSDEVKLSISPSPLTELIAGSDTQWVGVLKFEVASGEAYIENLTLSLHGTLPPQYVDNFSLYRDSDASGSFEAGADALAYTSDDFTPVNRATVELTGLKVKASEQEEFFIILSLSAAAPPDSYVGVGAITYKDLKVSTPNYVHYKNLPQMTDLKKITKPDVLFVNDDDEYGAGEWYLPHLDQLGLKYIIYNVPYDANGPSFSTMSQYKLVIWINGPAFYPLSPQDRNSIQSYLAAGGDLLLSARDIGFQAEWEGFTNWLQTVLHAQYVMDDAEASYVSGFTGDPITDGLWNLGLTGGYVLSEGWNDKMTPVNGATHILRYVDGFTGDAGLRYESGDSRLVYLFFAVEAMGKYSDRQTLLARCIDWLQE